MVPPVGVYMKKLFYEEWYKKRVQKIINIFGQNWFAGKNILELGAAHGDIGFEFAKLGAQVTFSDIRFSNLNDINNKFEVYGFKPLLHQLDQEKPYDLNKTFDLVLHLSVLYHLKNWKQDLVCSLSHGKILILETIVDHVKPEERILDGEKLKSRSINYNGNSGDIVYFGQEEIEEILINNNCKFIRLDSSELNTNVSLDGGGVYIQHLYDWDYDVSPSLSQRYINNRKIITHFRRFWLIIP